MTNSVPKETDLIPLKPISKKEGPKGKSSDRKGSKPQTSDRKPKEASTNDRKTQEVPVTDPKPIEVSEDPIEEVSIITEPKISQPGPSSKPVKTKTLEEQIKENEELDAIFNDCELAELRGQKEKLLPGEGSIFDTCNVCKRKKSKTEAWADHNITDIHIAALINQKGFGRAVRNLNQNISYSRIHCDLCATWFKDPITFQAHKNWPEHRARLSDVHRWSEAARKRKFCKGTWTRIAKPEKFTAKDLSKGIKQLKYLK